MIPPKKQEKALRDRHGLNFIFKKKHKSIIWFKIDERMF